VSTVPTTNRKPGVNHETQQACAAMLRRDAVVDK
jgi:hypothetical protein